MIKPVEPVEAINQSYLDMIQRNKKRMANFMCKLPDEENWDVGVYGLDAEEAARLYAEYCWDNRDGWEWLRSGTILECKNISTGEITRHSIEVESVTHFMAKQQ